MRISANEDSVNASSLVTLHQPFFPTTSSCFSSRFVVHPALRVKPAPRMGHNFFEPEEIYNKVHDEERSETDKDGPIRPGPRPIEASDERKLPPREASVNHESADDAYPTEKEPNREGQTVEDVSPTALLARIQQEVPNIQENRGELVDQQGCHVESRRMEMHAEIDSSNGDNVMKEHDPVPDKMPPAHKDAHVVEHIPRNEQKVHVSRSVAPEGSGLKILEGHQKIGREDQVPSGDHAYGDVHQRDDTGA